MNDTEMDTLLALSEELSMQIGPSGGGRHNIVDIRKADRELASFISYLMHKHLCRCVQATACACQEGREWPQLKSRGLAPWRCKCGRANRFTVKFCPECGASRSRRYWEWDPDTLSLKPSMPGREDDCDICCAAPATFSWDGKQYCEPCARDHLTEEERAEPGAAAEEMPGGVA